LAYQLPSRSDGGAAVMSSKGIIRDLRGYVESVLQKTGVPALSIAVWHDQQLIRAAAGLLNADTGVEATVDSVFQIGSITKAFTASLVMLLVDEGRLNLDRPVKQYLKSFHVLERSATEAITLRHLLSHTSGLVSDSSLGHDDSQEEGNPIARYVDRCFLLPQVHEQIGRRFSYSNAAYVIAGRVIEVVAGLSWRQAIEQYIIGPLNMTGSIASPADAIRFRAAVGHWITGRAGSRKVSVAPNGYLLLGMAPTGSVLTMTATDLLKFGRAHLNGGITESGYRWLSRASVEAMRRPQIELPAPVLLREENWGLGWGLTNFGGVERFGHGGGTIGQEALLQVIPESDAAFAVQLNGTTGDSLALQTVMTDLCSELTGVKSKKQAMSNDVAATLQCIGRFGVTGFRFEINMKGESLQGRIEVDSGAALSSQNFELRRLTGNTFEARSLDGDRLYDVSFVGPDSRGRPEYLFYGYRLHRRLS
jgi:CubicO group peptidase (beta-lactamase class C family)